MSDGIQELREQGFAPLLEMARPDMYRRNGFRLTELPVHATTRDLRKRLQMLEMALKANMALPAGPLRVFPLEDGRNPQEVREAVHVLSRPESRLVHEFFWFWRQERGLGHADEALTALIQGDRAKAMALWSQQEQSLTESFVSTHNLAVMRHLSALDLEWVALSRALSPDEQREVARHWESALQRWRALLEQEGFWTRVTTRVREMDDPRLTAATARRLRASLPLALLAINARLAVQAAERGDEAQAGRQLEVLRLWDGTPTDVPPVIRGARGGPVAEGSRPLSPVAAEALRRALEPIRERLKQLCKSTGQTSSDDAEHADRAARNLLEQAQPLLRIVDLLLPPVHATRIAMHDEVALAALQCQIVHGNKTKDWKTSADLLSVIVAVAASDSARSRIKQNLSIVTENRDSSLCWFCGANQGEEHFAIKRAMFGDVQRSAAQIAWKHTTRVVPRCVSCHTAHTKRGALTALLVILWLVVTVQGTRAINMALDDRHPHAPADPMVLGLVCLVALAAIALTVRWIPRGMKPSSAFKEHPAVKELLNKGWLFGERPEQ